MTFTIKIEPEAYDDIQQGIDWYNSQQEGLGERFHQAVHTSIDKLRTHPFYRLYYENVRVLLMRKYPYMIHFTVDEQEDIVSIRAVIHTSRDPENW